MRAKSPLEFFLWHLLNFVNNIIYNLLPFFTVKRLFLSALGARLGRRSFIHAWAQFVSPRRLAIGDNCTINYGCLLDARSGIEIGNNVMIGHRCRLYTLGHDLDDPRFGPKGGVVRIRDHAVLFTNVLVMPGVTIHEGAAVMSGSVVTKDVGPYEIVGGNPARFIRQRSRVIDYRLDYGVWFGV
jgi:acetyltransferase-like isoleucine patch superfamily enzyme